SISRPRVRKIEPPERRPENALRPVATATQKRVQQNPARWLSQKRRARRAESANARPCPRIGRAPPPNGSGPRPATSPAVRPATQSEPAEWDVSASERLARENHRPLHPMIPPAGR